MSILSLFYPIDYYLLYLIMFSKALVGTGSKCILWEEVFTVNPPVYKKLKASISYLKPKLRVIVYLDLVICSTGPICSLSLLLSILIVSYSYLVLRFGSLNLKWFLMSDSTFAKLVLKLFYLFIFIIYFLLYLSLLLLVERRVLCLS